MQCNNSCIIDDASGDGKLLQRFIDNKKAYKVCLFDARTTNKIFSFIIMNNRASNMQVHDTSNSIKIANDTMVDKIKRKLISTIMHLDLGHIETRYIVSNKNVNIAKAIVNTLTGELILKCKTDGYVWRYSVYKTRKNNIDRIIIFIGRHQ